ncbi:hypothetical protein AVEN_18747-1 [Araneus ventricosus]|uniref:Uncharacterized protein n=1 Tax=Araneus ventricosus TaxID=182803 RepID=A0A4Y2G7Q6_ARAVE|nr:hypothetical protein AVEN_18747-1 [Araneus ventricosus]
MLIFFLFSIAQSTASPKAAGVVRYNHPDPAYPTGFKALKSRRERKLTSSSRRTLLWCGSLERGVTAQMSSSSSDRVSKFRGPSQNSPRVASKRDVNITKLNETD